MKTVYRIINAMMAAGVFVAAFFANFVKITIGTNSSLDEFFSELSKGESTGIAVAETFSIKRFIMFFTGKDPLSVMLKINTSKVFLWPDEFNVMNVRLGLIVGSFVLMLALALFVIIYSCISGKRLPMLITGIVGVALAIVFIRAFNSIAYDILSGEINVVDYVVDSILGEGVLVGLLGSVASSAVVIYLTLAGMHIWLFVLFLGIAMWTAIFYLVDIGDPEAKKLREEEKKSKLAKKAEKKAKKEAKKAAKEKEATA